MTKKPFSRKPQHGGLSRQVNAALEFHGKASKEHKFTVPVAQDYLLGKLKLSKPDFNRARQLEIQSFRVLDSMNAVAQHQPIRMSTARAIIAEMVRQLPNYLERNKVQMPRQEREQGFLLLKQLKHDLERTKTVPEELPTTLDPLFLENARIINLEELRLILGEKKYNRYMKAMGKVFGVLQKKWRQG